MSKMKLYFMDRLQSSKGRERAMSRKLVAFSDNKDMKIQIQLAGQIAEEQCFQSTLTKDACRLLSKQDLKDLHSTGLLDIEVMIETLGDVGFIHSTEFYSLARPELDTEALLLDFSFILN